MWGGLTGIHANLLRDSRTTGHMTFTSWSIVRRRQGFHLHLPDPVYRGLADERSVWLQIPLGPIARRVGPFPVVHHHYRILRIPGLEYISSCLLPFLKRYSTAVKSFLPTVMFFWNSDLSMPLMGGSLDAEKMKRACCFRDVPSKS